VETRGGDRPKADPMRKSIIALLAVLIPAIFLAEPELANVSAASGIHSELRSLVSAWLAAVLRRDLDALVGLAAPEDRDGVRAALLDGHSDLTRALFSGADSVRARFLATPKPRIYLFAHTHLADHGNGTTGCIAAHALLEPLPDRAVELPESFTAEPIFCQFFWRGDGRWYPNFSHGWPDEDGGS
jgi:hypothetical protein